MGWVEIVTAGPAEAIIISGFMHEPPTLIVGGRAFIIPWLHKVQKLQLNTMTLVLNADHVYTNKGVPLSMTGIAQVESEWPCCDDTPFPCCSKTYFTIAGMNGSF